MGNASISAGGAVTVSVDVANFGYIAGHEVVQLYVTHPGISVARSGLPKPVGVRTEFAVTSEATLPN